MTPKEKASMIFFEHWFKHYNQMHKKAYKDAQKELEQRLNESTDPKIIEYWLEVQQKLSSLKG